MTPFAPVSAIYKPESILKTNGKSNRVVNL